MLNHSKTSFYCASVFILLINNMNESRADNQLFAKAVTGTITVSPIFPANLARLSKGSVIYHKEAALSLLTGIHQKISLSALKTIDKAMIGRGGILSNQYDAFSTNIPGIGVRFKITLVTPGAPKREWTMPFNVSLDSINSDSISMDDLIVSIDFIKTGDVQFEHVSDFYISSLMRIAINRLVVNFVAHFNAPRANCTINIADDQISLPTIEVSELTSKRYSQAFPVNVQVQCTHSRIVSFNITGEREPGTLTILKNNETTKPANGAGVQFLYKNNPVALYKYNSIPASGNFKLPLSLRYAVTKGKVVPGKIKSQATINVNYL